MIETKERIANSIPIDALLSIDGVVDIEDPIELNAIILIMRNGEKYRLTVAQEVEQEY